MHVYLCIGCTLYRPLDAQDKVEGCFELVIRFAFIQRQLHGYLMRKGLKFPATHTRRLHCQIKLVSGKPFKKPITALMKPFFRIPDRLFSLCNVYFICSVGGWPCEFCLNTFYPNWLSFSDRSCIHKRCTSMDTLAQQSGSGRDEKCQR